MRYLGTSDGAMVGKLEWQIYTSEFESHSALSNI